MASYFECAKININYRISTKTIHDKIVGLKVNEI